MAGDQDSYLLLISVKKPFTTSLPALQPMLNFLEEIITHPRGATKHM